MRLRRRRYTHYKLRETHSHRPVKRSKWRSVVKYGVVLPVVLLMALGLSVEMFTGKGQKAASTNNQQTHSSNASDLTPLTISTNKQPTISGASVTQNTSYETELKNTLSGFGSSFSSSNINPYSSANRSLYNSYMSSSNKSDFCSGGCTVYDNSGNSLHFSCYSSLNSCTTYDSNGNTANTYCYNYLDSCSTYTSTGNSYNTQCYSSLNSCSTYGSDGYHSNTNCYSSLNSCTTYDSSGNYYNTNCYSSLNSCSTYGSDGLMSTTNCYATLSSCTTYGY